MIRGVVDYSRMIKLSHSIFAMPFALAAAVLAAVEHGYVWTDFLWIVICMVAARSAAMGFNRIVDRDIDAENPRTADRAIPAGTISVRAAWAFTGMSAAVFLAGAWLLSPLCLALAPIVLAIICGYSLTKRFTALCHLFLGLALALAPTAAWIAISDTVAPTALILSGIVGTWVAGFDIIYACQDADFDRRRGLNSIPERIGVKGALVVSALMHVVTVGLLAALPAAFELSWTYWLGFLAITAMLAYEHWLVRPDDLSRIDKAFFDLNGYVSLAFFGVVIVSL
ncbi:MAG TPA: UbiA-like polyprenyltransferase [Myxococcota bacterium]|nr:UbiA-like polyprenyltransferase [Myxococcota bacterium]